MTQSWIPRLRLVHLFLLILVIALPLAGYAYVIQQHREVDKIEEELSALGASWSRYPTSMRLLGVEIPGFDYIGTLKLTNSRVTDDFFLKLPLMITEHDDTVILKNTQITDASLEKLENMTQLGALLLSNTKIKGSGLVHLRNCQRLKTLYLDDCEIAPDELEHLSSLTNLEILSLRGTRINGASLKYLTEMKRLEALDISNTDVDADGLRHLLQLPVLEQIDVSGTKIDPKIAKQLDLPLIFHRKQ